MKVVPKQDYTPPKLQVYGDLGKLTQGGTKGSKNDHAGGNVKTN